MKITKKQLESLIESALLHETRNEETVRLYEAGKAVDTAIEKLRHLSETIKQPEDSSWYKNISTSLSNTSYMIRKRWDKLSRI